MAVPAEVVNQLYTWTLKGFSGQCFRPHWAPASSILDYINSLDPWEHELLEHVEILVDEAALWDALCSQCCIIATDGSAPTDQGSFAWVISDSSGGRLAQCAGTVQAKHITSYREEGYGILSALRFLLCCCAHNNSTASFLFFDAITSPWWTK
jgi:hypothetical protein